jgi:hypothetical protein
MILIKRFKSVNSLCVLRELHAEDGGMKLNRNLVDSLVNRLSEFNEWGLCTVLDSISSYMPDDEDQIFEYLVSFFFLLFYFFFFLFLSFFFF